MSEMVHLISQSARQTYREQPIVPGYNGITSSWVLRDSGALKRTALMFDTLTVFDLGSFLWKLEAAARSGDSQAAERVREIDWLREKGFLLDAIPDYTTGIRESVEVLTNLKGSTHADEIPVRGYDHLSPELVHLLSNAANAGIDELGSLWCRMYAAEYRRLTNNDAAVVETAIAPLPRHSSAAPFAARQQVVGIVMQQLPVPSAGVPWEQVLEFRSDPEAMRRFYALKHWMNEVLRRADSITPFELEDEIRALLHRYQDSMRIHRMEANQGVLETLVTTSADLVENLVKFKWGSAARALFSFRHRKLQLLKAEIEAPGRELAYLVSAAERLR